MLIEFGADEADVACPSTGFARAEPSEKFPTVDRTESERSDLATHKIGSSRYDAPNQSDRLGSRSGARVLTTYRARGRFWITNRQALIGKGISAYGSLRVHSWQRGSPPVPDFRYSRSMLFPVLQRVLLWCTSIVRVECHGSVFAMISPNGLLTLNHCIGHPAAPHLLGVPDKTWIATPGDRLAPKVGLEGELMWPLKRRYRSRQNHSPVDASCWSSRVRVRLFSAAAR